MKKGFDLITFLFWASIVFYLDPGGFRSHGEEVQMDSLVSSVLNFAFIAFAWACFLFKYNSKVNESISSKFIWWYTIIIIIWALYYFFWFYGLNNSTLPGPMKIITRNQRMIGQLLLVYPIVYFASIDLKMFVKILTWSTIIIILMFALSVFLNLDLVKVAEGIRGMGLKARRFFLFGTGIMAFSIPLALSLLIMKYKKDNVIIFSAIMAAFYSFLTIYRRDIIGIIEYSIIIAFLVNYIYRSKTFNFIWRFINVKSVSVIAGAIVIVIIMLPDVVETTQAIVENTYKSIILGEVKDSSDDARLSLTAQYGIINAIQDNFLFGTGFDNSWNTGDGGVKGFEGSDYIFLASFGMYGLVGLLIFLPFYIITVKLLSLFIKLLRNNLSFIKQHNNIFIYPVIVGIAASAEFIKNIIEYPNWFYPIGAVKDSGKYFIYFGLLLGSYYQIVKHITAYKSKLYKE